MTIYNNLINKIDLIDVKKITFWIVYFSGSKLKKKRYRVIFFFRKNKKLKQKTVKKKEEQNFSKQLKRGNKISL